MAAFIYQSLRSYIEDSTSYLGVGSPSGSNSNGVLSDDGGDSFFTDGETINDSNSGSGTFGGVFTSGGTTYVVIIKGSGATIYSDNTTSNSSFPNPFFLSSADDSPFLTLCFAEGTLIATPSGETAVESLSIGDLVHTHDGRNVPVKWIGRQTIVKAFAQDRASLVRIGAGALGNHSDLFVTGDHGMVFGDCLVNASALVDGERIDWVPLSETPDRFNIYHVETEAHDILLANGAPTESYIDMPSRRAFDNFGEYLDLYGTERSIAPNPLPRISSPRLMPGRRVSA